jgi:transcriptional regulator with XRE-family HTH domain
VYPNLKLQIWKLGLRQNRLARELNLDETILSRVVNGFREPSPELRMNIAAILRSDPDWLFARDEDPEDSDKQGGGPRC